MFKDFLLKLRVYCTQKSCKHLKEVDYILYDLMKHGKLIKCVRDNVFVKYKGAVYLLNIDHHAYEDSFTRMWICSKDLNENKDNIFYRKRPSRYIEYKFLLWIKNQMHKKVDVYEKFCNSQLKGSDEL